MSWVNPIRGILARYVDRQPETPGKQPGVQHVTDLSAAQRDFEQVAQKAPPSALVRALVDMFRSRETPPFGQLVAHLFAQSDAWQRAELLNHLLTVSPEGAADDVLRLIGPNREVTPEEAQHVRPEIVQRVASELEKREPSIVERIAEFYAERPKILKTLGVNELALTMARIGAQLSEQSFGA